MILSIQTIAAQRLESCAISATHLQEQRKQRSFLLVDVRLPALFDRAFIPQSLNIQSFAIKNNPFLVAGSVILFDDGHHPSQLLDTCSQLRQQGWQATVMVGGLNAWHNAGGDVVGDYASISALHRLTPENLWRENTSGAWQLINIALTELPTLPSPLTQHLAVPFTGDPILFFQRLREAMIRSHPQPELVPIMLFDEQGTGYAPIERLLRHSPFPAIFVLEGGAAAYTKYLESLNQRATEASSQEFPDAACRKAPGFD